MRRVGSNSLDAYEPQWPTHPELRPHYWRGRIHYGERVPARTPFDVEWYWHWTSCDGRYWTGEDDTRPALLCEQAADFTCPVHA